jgi:hypothetical protein
MSLRFVSILAALVFLAVAPSRSEAQTNGTETQQCSMIRVMQWLSIAAGVGSGAEYDALSMRERIACGAGVEASSPEYWPSGATLRSGDAWYYPSGATAITGSATYYPNGATAGSGDAWYYPNGATMMAGGQYYLPNGASSSESGVLEYAMGRLSRERADELLGLRMRSADAFWRNLFFVVMVSEASRA